MIEFYSTTLVFFIFYFLVNVFYIIFLGFSIAFYLLLLTMYINRLAANVPLLEHVLEPSSLFIKSCRDDSFRSNDTFRYVLCADVPKLD